MPSSLRRPALAALLVALVAEAAAAQNVPRRPRLSNDADTNDAVAYYDFGIERFERDPDRAAAAFYWASRLDPASAPVWYARYAAELAHDNGRLVKYLLRDQRAVATREVQAIDSLRLRAFALNPFTHRGLEQPLIKRYAQEAMPHDAFLLTTNTISDPEMVRMIEQYLSETDPYLRGSFAYGRGELQVALQFWGNALNHESDWLRAERAGAFFEARRLDSARADIEKALSRQPGDEPHRLWENHAGYQVVLGRILEEQRNVAAARAAYQDAYAANAAFYPAYLRLAVLGLRTGDTVSAIAALSRELEIMPNDFFAHVTLGAALNNKRQFDSALVHLRRATELEPWASAGWLLLARVQDGAADTTHALASFQKYLSLAPRNDPERLLADRRILQLSPSAQRP